MCPFTSFFLYTSNLQGLTIQQYKNRNSKIQVTKHKKTRNTENKTQTLRKYYTFLSKACTRREHININNNNNNNNNDNNNNKNERKKRKKL